VRLFLIRRCDLQDIRWSLAIKYLSHSRPTAKWFIFL